MEALVSVNTRLSERQFARIMQAIADAKDELLCSFKEEMKKMAGEIELLKAAVERVENIGDSLITAYKGIAEQLKTLPDMAAVVDFANRLNAQADEMASATLANTPVEPAPSEPVTPVDEPAAPTE